MPVLPMLKTDFHIHTSLCHHAVGTMEQYVTAALEQGLERICFTDHVPLPDGFDPTHRMLLSELPGYYDEVARLREFYQDRLEINLGLECEFMPGLEPWLEKVVEQSQLDYLLGSVHYLGPFGAQEPVFVMRPGNVSLEELEPPYWQQMEGLVASGLFDAVAHLDIFKQSGWQPGQRELPQITRVLDLMAKKNMALELNSSGWDKPAVKTAYPDLSLLELAKQRDIDVIYGSDAHAPEQVGRYRQRMTSRLLECGFSRHVVFNKRKCIPLLIQE